MTGWLSTHFAIVGVIALTGAAMLLVLRQRRTPQTALAWLSAFVLVPYIAIPLFLVLGLRGGGPMTRPLAFSKKSIAPVQMGPFGEALASYGLPPASNGNHVRLLFDGISAWAALRDLLNGADVSIDVQFYLIQNDAVGRAFVEHLTRKAQEGCSVRVLIDGIGGIAPPRSAIRGLRAAGGTVKFVSPIVHIPTHGRLNQRNHRKAVIVDGTRVFAGGMNVGMDYMGPQGAAWDDLSFVVEGPAVEDFRTIFTSDFGDATGQNDALSSTGSAVLQVAPSGPDVADDALHDALVHAIHTARRRVWLTTPYFIPTEGLMQALAMAARRGVDLQLVVPTASNHRLADLAAGSCLRDLADAGAKVLLGPRMIHAKAGVIDDEAWCGSANLDVRSLLLNNECITLAQDRDTVDAIADWFLIRAATCEAGPAVPSRAKRIAEAFVRLASPIL